MPLMHLTFTRGAVPPGRVQAFANDMMDVVLRHHVAAKLREQLVPVFRIRITEVDPEMHLTGGRPLGKPVYDVELVVPAGSVEGDRRDRLVRDLTETVLAEEGVPWSEEDAHRVWIIVRDIPDGKWAVGGVAISARYILEYLIRMKRAAKRKAGSRVLEDA